MSLSYHGQAVGGNTISGTNPTIVGVPTVGDLWLIFCVANGNTNVTPTCSDTNTGGTYSLVFTVQKNGSTDTISCFVRDNLFANTTSTTVTVAIGAHTATEAAIISITGATVASLGCISQFATQANQAGGITPSPIFANPTNYTNLQLSVVGNGTNPAGVSSTIATTSNGAWTLVVNAGQTACGLGVQTTVQNVGATTVTWGSSSGTAFAAGLVEITIPPNPGVDVTKLLGVALTTPSVGVDVTKLMGVVLPTPSIGVDVSKLVSYAVLANSNLNPPVWPVVIMPTGILSNSYFVSWDLSPAAAPTTYTIVSGSLPPGLTLASPSGDVGNITGIPTALGTYSFTIRATNAYGIADDAFTINVITATGGGGGGSYTYAG